MWERMQNTVQLDVGAVMTALCQRMSESCILGCKIQPFRFTEPHLKMLDPYVGFGDAVTQISKK